MRGLLAADVGLPAPRPAVRPPTGPVAEDVVRPGPSDEFEPGWAGLGDALPPGTAMLCVTGSGSAEQPRISMTWHHERTVQSAPSQPELPQLGLSLARLMKDTAASAAGPVCAGGDGPWSAAYHQVRNWWLYQSTLVRWIRDLFAFSPQPQLVIWDNTSYNIPWELFYLERSVASGGELDGWLGELVPVVRWTSVHDGPRVWDYSAPRHASKGGLVMLLEGDLDVPVGGFPDYLAAPPYRTVDDLMRRLDQPDEPLGLIMIRAHGAYSQSGNTFTIGGRSLNRFTGYPMHTLQDTGPPVLLNACASGQAMQDEQLPGRPVRSFVELFLRKGASAVVAVIGDIDIDHSHDFAARLLEDASDQPVNLASVLQEHRRHYAKRTRNSSGKDEQSLEMDFKLFLTSFLYVYYGHPDTTLHLTHPGAVANGESTTGTAPTGADEGTDQ
ncbi:hypothetical protein ACIGZJ_14500 [Kitasatospora sp. NPDC052868]|uniref:hypothetical protein n=1 Tax=Kitasatospora sp. NPDC052868 TaxID=3364060 RepID=UPI0037CB991F